MTRPDTNNDGFSLVEVLLAMFIFALVSVAVAASLQGGARARDQLAREAHWLEDLQTMRALMTSDLQYVVLRPSRTSTGLWEKDTFAGGKDDLLRFTRGGRPNPGGMMARSELQRVRYLVQDGNLLRVTLGNENPGPQTRIVSRTMISGIKTAEIDFHSGNQAMDSWQVSALGGRQILPDYITLTLNFADGRELVQQFEVGT